MGAPFLFSTAICHLEATAKYQVWRSILSCLFNHFTQICEGFKIQYFFWNLFRKSLEKSKIFKYHYFRKNKLKKFQTAEICENKFILKTPTFSNRKGPPI